MTATIENDISKLLTLFRQCDEEYHEMVEIMDAQYIRATLGYSSTTYWTERQRNDILRHFQDVVDRRCKIRRDIQVYYMKKIREAGKSPSVQLATFMSSLENAPTWTSTLEFSPTTTRVILRRNEPSKFVKFLRIMKMCFVCRR